MNRGPLPLCDKDPSLLDCDKRQTILSNLETFNANVDVPVLKLIHIQRETIDLQSII